MMIPRVVNTGAQTRNYLRASPLDPARSLLDVRRPRFRRSAVPPALGVRGDTRIGARLPRHLASGALELQASTPVARSRTGRQAPVPRRREAHPLQVRGRPLLAPR